MCVYEKKVDPALLPCIRTSMIIIGFNAGLYCKVVRRYECNYMYMYLYPGLLSIDTTERITDQLSLFLWVQQNNPCQEHFILYL